MDMAAFGAPQGPVLESGTSRDNVLNMQARLAFETAGPLRRARRQSGHLWIGHRASVHGAGALPNSLSPKNAKGRRGDAFILRPSPAGTLVNIAHS